MKIQSNLSKLGMGQSPTNKSGYRKGKKELILSTLDKFLKEVEFSPLNATDVFQNCPARWCCPLDTKEVNAEHWQ